MSDIEAQVLQAISRVTHRPLQSLSAGQNLKQDLGLVTGGLSVATSWFLFRVFALYASHP